MTKPTMQLRRREDLIPRSQLPRCRFCGKPVPEYTRAFSEVNEDEDYIYETTVTFGTGRFHHGGHFCTLHCATIWAVDTANELHGRISA